MLSGEVAGIVVAYPVRQMQSLEFPMALDVLRIAGLARFVQFLARSVLLAGVKEAEADEYFISNVAVLPRYQGQGLGSSMMRQVEAQARELGFSRLSLTVEVENERARSLYARLGYEVVATVGIKVLQRRFGYQGFHRMRKSLP